MKSATNIFFQEFTYSFNYLDKWVVGAGGGSSLELHDFVHLNCPLSPMSKSGHFVLAKFMDQAKTTLEVMAKNITQASDYLLYIKCLS